MNYTINEIPDEAVELSGNEMIPIWQGETKKVSVATLYNNRGDYFPQSRWLRFSPSDKKSLVIKAGTTIVVGSHTYFASTDTTYSMGDTLTAGKDYHVYLNYSAGVWTVTCTQTKTADTTTSRWIGQFHTLCVGVPAGETTTTDAVHGSVSVNDTLCVKHYTEDDYENTDFYNFYLRTVTAVTGNDTYDTVTVVKPLAGFDAGDILPESIWSLTFYPEHCKADGMVYDPDTDTASDIYLQSGKGRNTKSVYGGTTTRNRQPINHQADMLDVGKKLPTDNEFLSFAKGSNEKTNIKGSAESSVTTTGGHVDTQGKRMVSFIGVEDCCGTIWQWLDELGPVGGSGFSTYDGNASFGQSYGVPYVLVAGGDWNDGASCGSRCRNAYHSRSTVNSNCGARGSCRVRHGAK